MAKHILSVSYDETLLTTRALLLEGAGYRVTSALCFADARSACLRGGFDLFVLGHSVRHEDKEELIQTFRKHCAAPILSLRRTGDKLVDTAEFHIFPDDPAKLIRSIAEILGGEADPVVVVEQPE